MSPFSGLAVGVSALLLLGAGVAFAQVVVFSAHRPSSGSYPQGAVLRADKIITLKAGDSVELLDAVGSRVIKGPANVVAGQKPSFARGDSGAPAPVSISRTATGEKRAITWSAGGLAADWPAGLPFADGETYSVAFEYGSAVTLIWPTVSRSTEGVEPLGADLLSKGCYTQLDGLRAASGIELPF